MAGLDDKKTDANDPDAIRVEATGDDDLYAVSEPEPDSPEAGIGATTPAWYVAVAGGQKEGPFALLDLKQRVASGRLNRQMLVWKSGMPDWSPAGAVPELFEVPDQLGPPPLPPSGGAISGGATPDVTAKAAEVFEQADRLFASPNVYRMTGRVSAALGALMLLAALILLPFGPPGSAVGALTITLLLAGIFLIGEATGAILQALKRIDSHLAEHPQSEEDLR